MTSFTNGLFLLLFPELLWKTTSSAILQNCSETKSDCEVTCGGAGNATFTDYAALGTGDEDSNFLIRTKTCICGPYDPNEEFCFECDFCEQATKVWDLNDYSPSCNSFSPFSLTTLDRCRLFCSDIDPFSYAYGTGDKEAYCKCAGELVCGSGGAVADGRILPISILSLSIWFLLTTLY